MKSLVKGQGGVGYICQCPPGFKLRPNGKTCKKVHPCDRKDNGGCTDICMKDGEKVKCECEKGFKLLPDKATCVPVHPCEKKTKGGCSHTCTKKGLGVTCSCPKGLQLEEDLKTCEQGESITIGPLNRLIGLISCDMEYSET